MIHTGIPMISATIIATYGLERGKSVSAKRPNTTASPSGVVEAALNRN